MQEGAGEQRTETSRCRRNKAGERHTKGGATAEGTEALNMGLAGKEISFVLIQVEHVCAGEFYGLIPQALISNFKVTSGKGDHTSSLA